MKDNKLTPNDFWLMLETFDSTEAQHSSANVDASDYTIHPTVLSFQTNLALNSPIIPLVHLANQSHSSIVEVSSARGFKGQPHMFLPCDVHLLSFRTMRLEPRRALIILQRGVSNYQIYHEIKRP